MNRGVDRFVLSMGAFVICVATAATCACTLTTVNTNVKTEESNAATELVNDFHRDVVLKYQLSVLDQEVSAAMSESFERKLRKLKARISRKEKRAPSLRRARAEFDRYTETVHSVIFVVLPSFQQMVLLSSSVSQDEVLHEYKASLLQLDHDVHALLDEYIDITEESLSRSMLIVHVATVFCYVIFVSAVVSLLVFRSRACARLSVQDRLTRQQVHEMRNKYAPAYQLMQQFLDICEGESVRAEEFLAMKDDMRVAVVLLKEVETQIQTRLDVYKMMRKRYVETRERFDLLEFMRHRTRAEEAVAKAHDPDSNVKFVVELPQEYRDCNEIYCSVDMYVLDHVVANCLSNARKFTPQSGTVKLSLVGSTLDALVFSVRDTGAGIPESIKDQLFQHEISTGDRRGTGLGLPSCSLYCQSVGGYIALKSTELSSGSKNGHTEIEFAVGGEIVAAFRTMEEDSNDNQEGDDADDPPVYIPNDLNVVIVDDSAVNRRCIERSLTKVALNAGATGWTFLQFSTVEAAQPTLRTPFERGGDQNTLVTLDQSMMSLGGLKTGSDAIEWLRSDERQFEGCIISASGDTEIGQTHLGLGADFAWGKPIPRVAQILQELKDYYRLRW